MSRSARNSRRHRYPHLSPTSHHCTLSHSHYLTQVSAIIPTALYRDRSSSPLQIALEAWFT